MNWLQLIERRRSVRRFLPDLDQVSLERVKALCRQNPQNENLHLLPADRVQLGKYGGVVAPWYIAVVGTKDQQSLYNLGYNIQRLVLELTAMKLGTCWMGSFFNQEALNASLGVEDGRGVQVLIALGLPDGDNRSKTLKSASGMGKRKAPTKISKFEPEVMASQHSWRTVLEAVRWAPSAVNRQPWRLWFTGRGVHLYSIQRKTLRAYIPIDMGIALCHLELACQQMDIKGAISKTTSYPRRNGWEYWHSFLLK